MTTDEIVYPKMERPINLMLPPDIQHLIRSGDRALVRMRIGLEGEVLDWIPLNLPHHRLVSSIGVALRGARFSPALVNGEPVIVDIVGEILLRDVFQFAVVSQSVSDHLESYLVTLVPDLNQLVLHAPDELDRPLSILSTGDIYQAHDENGVVLTGTVKVEFYVDSSGVPRMVGAIGDVHPDLAEAAIRTVENFRFTPPRVKGRLAVTKARMPIVVKE